MAFLHAIIHVHSDKVVRTDSAAPTTVVEIMPLEKYRIGGETWSFSRCILRLSRRNRKAHPRFLEKHEIPIEGLLLTKLLLSLELY